MRVMLSRQFIRYISSFLWSFFDFLISLVRGWNVLGKQQQLLSTHFITRDFSAKFEKAQEKLQTLKEEPGNDIKLKLYGLYKQATVGKVNVKKPGMMDIVGKAKWDAWSQLGDLKQEEAEVKYAELVESLVKEESGSEGSGAAEASGLTVTIEDGVRTLLLNRPTKKNALTLELYQSVGDNLKEANDDKNTKIVVLTGAGDYYCSGNDLGNFANVSDIKATAEAGGVFLEKFIASFIDCKKPIIALVNGPAVGIAVTTLALCDTVYCADNATFTSPFSSLGQSPEGCSSLLFPRIMGYAKASELLFFNAKITADDAKSWGLVSEVFPVADFQKQAWARVNAYSKFPVKSMVYSKELVRGPERDLLHKVNKAECTRLVERWQSEDCFNAIMNFFNRKSKV